MLVRDCSRALMIRRNQFLLLFKLLLLSRASRSATAAPRRMAMGSFGGDPSNVLVIVSRQNCSRIRPIVYDDVVSGIMDSDTLSARKAR